jgi:hypothetical protein
MILGMTTSTFTFIHVLLSLAAIGTGFVVMFGLLAGKRLDGWTAIFIVTSMATSVTGFLFPFDKLLPSHVLGLLLLLVMVIAIWARYWFCLEGAWRWIYVVGAAGALYLDVFVAIVQAFRKIPALKAMAPTMTEPPFVIAQLLNLGMFVVLAILGGKRFRVGQRRTA